MVITRAAARQGVLLAVLLACAARSEELPLEERLEAAEEAIVGAEDAGAADHDFIGLSIARDTFERAKEAARQGDIETAKELADEAAIDAREAARQRYGGRSSR
jgi:hypothetical protein